YLSALMALGASFVSAAATPIRQLTNTQASNIRPAWSPDGKQIAFQTNRDGPYHIYVMSADGSNVRQLTSSDADDRHPAWSPDGKQLAIDSGDQTNREIWTIDVGSRQRTQITKLGGIASFPSWSPDGKRIAFYISQDQSWTDLWLVDPNSGAPRNEVAREVQVQGPFEFNADASQILFASPRTGNFEIYAVTLDDAGKAALATKPEHINPDQVSQVPQASGQNALGLPTTAEPYLLAFGLLALGAVAAEGLVRRRR